MLEIYDCTLREGEQAAGASFSLDDRIKLFKLLDEFGIEYIELGWPVNDEVLKAFFECKKIRKQAKIVAFGSTSIEENVNEDKNLKALVKSKAEYACIFGKTSLEHVEKQLKIGKEENLKRIEESIKFLKDKGIEVFYDAEHFFDAFKENPEYALETLFSAIKAGASRIILCDTNGGSLPEEVSSIIKKVKEKFDEKKLNVNLGIHFHDDSGLALANTLVSLPYILQVQGTINGIGERVGNLNFSEFLPVYIKKIGKELKINLGNLKEINEEAYRLSGLEIPEIRRFVGETAFAHKGGVHIDATNKGASYEHLNPEEIGNKRAIILNTLGGRAGVIRVAKEFGYELDKESKEVREKIDKLFLELKELENKGYRIGAVEAEQFLLIEKYFGNLKNYFEIEEWKVASKMKEKEESKFYVKCKINGEEIERSLEVEGGPVDAAYKTISKMLAEKYPEIKNLKLIDFHVGIARSKREESSVRTLITFQDEEIFQTAGVDSNIIQSAIEAIEKGFRYYLNRRLDLKPQNSS